MGKTPVRSLSIKVSQRGGGEISPKGVRVKNKKHNVKKRKGQKKGDILLDN